MPCNASKIFDQFRPAHEKDPIPQSQLFDGQSSVLNSIEDVKMQEELKKPEWIGDLIHDGFYDKIVLIGFPYDEGARKAGNRKGSDYRPGKFLTRF